MGSGRFTIDTNKKNDLTSCEERPNVIDSTQMEIRTSGSASNLETCLRTINKQSSGGIGKSRPTIREFSTVVVPNDWIP